MIARLLSLAALRLAADQARAGPYVEGAARDTRPWLRLLLFAGLAVVLSVVAVLLVGLAVGLLGPEVIDPALFQPSPEDWTLAGELVFLIALSAALILLAVCVLGAAMLAYRRPVAAFLWPNQARGWRQFLFGAAVMLALQMLFWPLSLWLQPEARSPLVDLVLTDAARYVAVASGALLIAALAEEIVFRGVLLRIVGGLTRRTVLTCLVTGVLFSLIHFDPDPVAFVLRAMSGVVWAWAALRLGGIAFAVGAHWINNLFIALLLEPISLAAQPGQGLPPVYIAIELVSFIAFLLAAEWLARRRLASAAR